MNIKEKYIKKKNTKIPEKKKQMKAHSRKGHTHKMCLVFFPDAFEKIYYPNTDRRHIIHGRKKKEENETIKNEHTFSISQKSMTLSNDTKYSENSFECIWKGHYLAGQKSSGTGIYIEAHTHTHTEI